MESKKKSATFEINSILSANRPLKLWNAGFQQRPPKVIWTLYPRPAGTAGALPEIQLEILVGAISWGLNSPSPRRTFRIEPPSTPQNRASVLFPRRNRNS
jgi:hypothetical protein